MIKPVRLDGIAEQEIEEAYSWYEDRESGQGERFLQRLAAALEAIEEAPEACTPVQGHFPAPVRAAGVRRFPYRVVFEELPDRYRVVAVAHFSRRPGYWVDRLEE